MYVWNVQESSEALVVTVASDKDNNNFCRDVFSLLALSACALVLARARSLDLFFSPCQADQTYSLGCG